MGSRFHASTVKVSKKVPQVTPVHHLIPPRKLVIIPKKHLGQVIQFHFISKNVKLSKKGPYASIFSFHSRIWSKFPKSVHSVQSAILIHVFEPNHKTAQNSQKYLSFQSPSKRVKIATKFPYVSTGLYPQSFTKGNSVKLVHPPKCSNSQKKKQQNTQIHETLPGSSLRTTSGTGKIFQKGALWPHRTLSTLSGRVHRLPRCTFRYPPSTCQSSQNGERELQNQNLKSSGIVISYSKTWAFTNIIEEYRAYNGQLNAQAGPIQTILIRHISFLRYIPKLVPFRTTHTHCTHIQKQRIV